jgi:hypothetical protein
MASSSAKHIEQGKQRTRYTTGRLNVHGIQRAGLLIGLCDVAVRDVMARKPSFLRPVVSDAYPNGFLAGSV